MQRALLHNNGIVISYADNKCCQRASPLYPAVFVL